MTGRDIAERMQKRAAEGLALLKRLRPDGYEPSKHYMRGPGPATQAKAARLKPRVKPKA